MTLNISCHAHDWMKSLRLNWWRSAFSPHPAAVLHGLESFLVKRLQRIISIMYSCATCEFDLFHFQNIKKNTSLFSLPLSLSRSLPLVFLLTQA